jgi:predicted MFS family arabinose efflux permease
MKVQTPIQTAQVVTQAPRVGPPVNETIRSAAAGIDNRLVWIMAIACGLSVGNLIYAHPLLAEIGRSFAVSANQIGLIATLGELGYALGLIFIAPLGEKYNQRSLIVILLGIVAIALVEMAVAPTSALLIIGSGAVGLASVIPELIIPFAAGLAPEKERGRVVGTLLCGLFVGTPLAAVFSGLVGQYLGWRTMYWIAGGIMIALAIVLHFALPNSHSVKKKVSYPQLLGSLWNLFRSEPVLQEVCILGILAYGTFNAFWVTLSFILGAAPYHYGSNVVGLFGLVGIAGALAALFVGKFADRRDARHANGIALAIALLAIVVMWLAGQWLIGLIVGAILLDLGIQSNQVANETRIYTLQSTAWTRLNTIHIFLICIGGSLGSALGTLGWRVAKQNGVYGTTCSMLIVALVFYALHSKRIRQWRKRQDG